MKEISKEKYNELINTTVDSFGINTDKDVYYINTRIVSELQPHGYGLRKVDEFLLVYILIDNKYMLNTVYQKDIGESNHTAISLHLEQS